MEAATGTSHPPPAFKLGVVDRREGRSLMKVAEVMTRGVDRIDPSASVQEAAIRMAELDVGALLVGSEEGLVGVLTDRDILLRVVVEGRSPAEVTVGEVMSSRLFTSREDDSVESALREMRERQIRRMPVYDESGRLTGIVTQGDLAKGIEGPEQMQEMVRQMSEPHRSRSAPQEERPGQAAAAGDNKATAA